VAHTEVVEAGRVVNNVDAWGDRSMSQYVEEACWCPLGALSLKDGIAAFLGGSVPDPAGGWTIRLLDVAPKACKIFGGEVSHRQENCGGIRAGEMRETAFHKARRKGTERLARVGLAIPEKISNATGRVEMVVKIEHRFSRGPGACCPEPASVTPRELSDFCPKAGGVLW